MTQDDIVNQVVQDVPEAPLMTIREAVTRMARELCTDADVWVQSDEPVVFGANTDSPAVQAAQGEPIRIVSLSIGGRDRLQGDGFFQPTPGTIDLDERHATSTISGQLACRPKKGEMPPPGVVSRWADVIADGARWRLLMLPQPWRDLEAAAYYQQRYLQGTSDAKQASRLGHARGGAKVKARRFV